MVHYKYIYTATIVLPHEHWQPWREANSAATIGRHSRMAHGIIIADNLHAQNLVKRAAENNKYIETEDPRELINRWLAEVFVSLHMTNIPENKPLTKIYETADYRRLFSNENYAGVLVPCFHEFGLEDFVKGGLNLNGAVFDTMKNHQLAAFELRDFESAIVIITFPAETSGLARNVVKNMGNTEDIAVRLQDMYGRDLEPAVVFTYSQSLTDTVKVTVLVKDPYVPRFPILYQRLKEIVDDPVNMRKALSEMFPRDYDDIERHEIMENAREEFMRAFYSFSGYLDEQGYDKHKYVERREPVRIRD